MHRPIYITPGAKVLAHSEGCPRQIIQFGDLVYGFQCHMELTREVVELLIEASESELAALKGSRFVQTPEVLRAHDHDTMNRTLVTFLDKLVVRYATA